MKTYWIESFLEKWSAGDYRILSGSALKVLAMVMMLIDHSARFVLRDNPSFATPFFSFYGHDVSLNYLMTFVGRWAFPIFAFLIVEGFLHTRNRFRYGRNLLVFAFISEIPWNLIHSGTLFWNTQNVFFTLFLGYLGLCVIEKYENQKSKMAISLLVLLFVPIILRTDYSSTGFGFILMLYVLRNQKILQAVIGCSILSSHWIGALAFIPINMYNGKRGFVQSKIVKYSFYAFYPLHLLLLWWIRSYLL